MTAAGPSGRTSGGARPEAPDGARRPPFTLIAAVTVTGILANALLAPALPDVVDEFGTGASGAGLLLAATTAPGIVLAPVIGLLADRFGRREVLVPCLILFGIAGGMGAFAPTFGALLALRLLQGVGSAGTINLAVVVIGDHWTGAERARLLGRNAAVLTASIAVVPPIGGLLAELGGWRLTFLPYWIGVVTGIAVAVVLPKRKGAGGSVRQLVAAAVPELRRPVVAGALTSSFVLFVLIFGVFLTLIPLHLDRRFGVPAAGRGLLIGLPAVASTAAALSVGRLRRALGARRLVPLGFFVFAAAFALMAAAPGLPALGAGALLYGAAEGAVIPTLQDIVSAAATPTTRGSVVAMFVGVARAGQTVGPIAATALAGAAGTEEAIGAAAAVALMLAIAQQLWLRRGARAPDQPRR